MWLYHLTLSVSYMSRESWVLFFLLLCSLVMCINDWIRLLSYFSVVVCPVWLYHHTLLVSYMSRESWVLFLLLLCSLVMCINDRIRLWPDGRICLFALYITSLSSLCIRIWRCWTYEILVSYTLSSVSMIKSIFSIIFHVIHGTVGIQRTQFSYDDCENMRICVFYLLSSSSN